MSILYFGVPVLLMLIVIFFVFRRILNDREFNGASRSKSASSIDGKEQIKKRTHAENIYHYNRPESPIDPLLLDFVSELDVLMDKAEKALQQANISAFVDSQYTPLKCLYEEAMPTPLIEPSGVFIQIGNLGSLANHWNETVTTLDSADPQVRKFIHQGHYVILNWFQKMWQLDGECLAERQWQACLNQVTQLQIQAEKIRQNDAGHD